MKSLRKVFVSCIIHPLWWLSTIILELCYKVDAEHTDKKLDVLSEKWWSREDSQIPHWEKATPN